MVLVYSGFFVRRAFNHTSRLVPTNQSHEQTNPQKVFDFLGLPPHTIIDTDAKNTRRYPPISPETKAKLARFYAPFNRQLFDLLGREMPGWAGVEGAESE